MITVARENSYSDVENVEEGYADVESIAVHVYEEVKKDNNQQGDYIELEPNKN